MALPESVRLKFRRAEEHRETLKIAIDGYFEAAKDKIWADAGGHAVALIAPDLPWQIPYIIGDCFQNLRSSLDYLAQELATASGSNPTDHTSFPVCRDAQCFGNKITERALAGISVEARAEIERVQPCRAVNDPARSNLWILHELCNINKHRRIYVTLLQVYSAQTAQSVTSADEVKMHRGLMADVAIKEGIVDERVLPFTEYMIRFIDDWFLTPFEQKFFR